MIKQHPNTPTHFFLDDTLYFITGAIYQRRKLLVEPELIISSKLCELI
jgi:hypothetical protein